MYRDFETRQPLDASVELRLRRIVEAHPGKMIERAALNPVKILFRRTVCGYEVKPTSCADRITRDAERFQRELIPVPEVIKKPSVEVFLPNGLLYALDNFSQNSSSGSSILKFSSTSEPALSVPQD